MQLTRTEMSLLCRVIGIKALASFAMFDELTKTEVSEAKQSLEEKELMLQGEFTKKGLDVTRVVHLFSEASFFLKLGKATFARYEDSEYAVLSEVDEVFEMSLLNQDQITAITLSKFKDLGKIEDDVYRKRFIKKDEFNSFMKENPSIEAIFFRSIDVKEQKETVAAMFVDNGYLNLYNVGREQMDCYPKRKVQSAIETMFA